MKRKYHVINGTLEKRFKPRKFQSGVQMVGARPTPPKNDVWADIGEIGLSAGAGVAGGAAAGPAGMIGGGIAGFATGLASVLSGNKAEQEQYDAEFDLWTGQRGDMLQGQIADSNQIAQQLNQSAKKGVYATGTEAIEVEKDELIFTKTETGKYVLKADYQGGKTHNKGGEDYQAADGDIIFPGKDRKKVMKAYKSQDFPKLESMRMSLPKDTQGGKARNGLDTDPKQQYADIQAQVKAGKLPQSFADNFYAQNANQLQDTKYDVSGVDFGDQRKGFNVDTDPGFRMRLQPDGSYKRTSSGLTSNQMIEDLEAATFNARRDNPLIESPDRRPFIGGDDSTVQQGEGAKVITPETPAGGGGKGVNPNANMPSAAMILQTVPTRVGLGEIAPMSNFKPGGIDVQSANQIGASTQQLGATAGDPGGGGGGGLAAGLGYAAQGLSALTNLFPGEAEVQRSPEVRLDRLKYKDTSALLRQQSKVNERLQASNARNVSGGNVQNYLANRRQAGISNLRTQQAIDTQEYQRRLGITGQNVQIANQEALYNNQLLQQDQQVNAANRSARQNIIRQGIGQLGQLGGQIGQDAMARENQALLAEAIGSGQYSAYGKFKG